MKLIFQRLIYLSILIVCFGCGKSALNESRLIGSYYVKFPHGIETLLLKDDKTFVQIYTRIENGQSQTNTGIWNFDSKFKDVILSGAVLYDNRQGQANTNLEKTVWDLPAIKRFEDISSSIDGEGVYEFQK